MAAHTLKHLKDIFLLHEGHLAVYLRELGLAVGTQVFIAEALADLEVAVNTCHHTELLEGLRTLRQGIELTGVHARRHNEVACAFGSGTNENRGFHFEESFAVEIAAHLDCHLVTQFKILAHSRTA